MVVGALAYPMIRRMLDSPLVVAVALVVGGIAILVIERLVREPRHADIDEFSAGLALRIGLVQLLSMVPGVSRDRKSTRLIQSLMRISSAVFCWKKHTETT